MPYNLRRLYRNTFPVQTNHNGAVTKELTAKSHKVKHYVV